MVRANTAQTGSQTDFRYASTNAVHDNQADRLEGWLASGFVKTTLAVCASYSVLRTTPVVGKVFVYIALVVLFGARVASVTTDDVSHLRAS